MADDQKDVEDEIKDVFDKGDTPIQDLAKVDKDTINQGFDGVVKNTDDDTLDLN